MLWDVVVSEGWMTTLMWRYVDGVEKPGTEALWQSNRLNTLI